MDVPVDSAKETSRDCFADGLKDDFIGASRAGSIDGSAGAAAGTAPESDIDGSIDGSMNTSAHFSTVSSIDGSIHSVVDGSMAHSLYHTVVQQHPCFLRTWQPHHPEQVRICGAF